jgi:hypothetical protein
VSLTASIAFLGIFPLLFEALLSALPKHLLSLFEVLSSALPKHLLLLFEALPTTLPKHYRRCSRCYRRHPKHLSHSGSRCKYARCILSSPSKAFTIVRALVQVPCPSHLNHLRPLPSKAFYCRSGFRILLNRLSHFFYHLHFGSCNSSQSFGISLRRSIKSPTRNSLHVQLGSRRDVTTAPFFFSTLRPYHRLLKRILSR